MNIERRFVGVTGRQLPEKLDHIGDDGALQLFQMVDDGVLNFSRKLTLKDGDEEEINFTGDGDEVRELVDGIVFSQLEVGELQGGSPGFGMGDGS